MSYSTCLTIVTNGKEDKQVTITLTSELVAMMFVSALLCICHFIISVLTVVT